MLGVLLTAPVMVLWCALVIIVKGYMVAARECSNFGSDAWLYATLTIGTVGIIASIVMTVIAIIKR
ncbi:hypothetical protein V757_00370 [Pelistega indica]|uniref:Uncharacterized protein n=1 Tax=Pelistega indica TaxID=1414851 RepID=V8G9L6_9BURK|nr:hypothetical protein [Pelistega indica]ETD73095.1 hypothetical protein V757_00370 [Pelistega indica]